MISLLSPTRHKPEVLFKMLPRRFNVLAVTMDRSQYTLAELPPSASWLVHLLTPLRISMLPKPPAYSLRECDLETYIDGSLATIIQERDTSITLCSSRTDRRFLLYSL